MSPLVPASDPKGLLRQLMYPERGFIRLVILYGLAISLLTLAVPIAVQTLIHSVVNIASVTALVSLVAVLFITLALSGLFSALRTYVMEKYERHIYARLSAEISVRTIMAEHEYFDGRRNLDITNRYFDINTLQKNLPPLLVDGFALVLQTLVGFTLVSFYHPVFLIFCLFLILILYLIWRLWGPRAVNSAVELSHAKYAMAKWLGNIAAAHNFFKSSQHIDFARQNTDALTAQYIQCHKTHFRYTFAQTIGLLLLYALASSALLGVGGMLVINGSLSVGQLVASELILTAVFFGLSKASTYLKLYYEMCGAADELGQVFAVPLEDETHEPHATAEHGGLEFDDVVVNYREQTRQLDFKLEDGKKVFALCDEAWLQRGMIKLLKRHLHPDGGRVRLSGNDLSDYRVQELRQAVSVIDNSLIVECTVEGFLKMSASGVTLAKIDKALELVELDKVINRLPLGIKTPLSALGVPLLPNEFLLLKLAASILAQPKLLVLSQHFDNMDAEARRRLLSRLNEQPFSILYFSARPEPEYLDDCLVLNHTESKEAS